MNEYLRCAELKWECAAKDLGAGYQFLNLMTLHSHATIFF